MVASPDQLRDRPYRQASQSVLIFARGGCADHRHPLDRLLNPPYVEQGDSVEKGQPLLTVLTSQIAGGGEDVNATILNTLNQQKQALTAQIVVEVQRTASERERGDLKNVRSRCRADHRVHESRLIPVRSQHARAWVVPARSGAARRPGCQRAHTRADPVRQARVRLTAG